MLKPRILITNDDGVHAPGIKHLWKALKDIADVTIVAPAVEQSAAGLSITIRRPLHIEEIRWNDESTGIWSVNGTPSDCVKLALSVIMPEPPHLIVSGINRGSNAGRNVLYSGTVAAVIEGILHDIPGIAFSVGDYQNPNYERITDHIPKIVDYAIKHPLPLGTLLNVNFPKQHLGEIKGIKMTRQGREFWVENPEKRDHPVEERHYYWLGAQLAQYPEHEDSDIAMLNQGFATAVPIHISELTDLNHMESQKQLFDEFVNV